MLVMLPVKDRQSFESILRGKVHQHLSSQKTFVHTFGWQMSNAGLLF